MTQKFKDNYKEPKPLDYVVVAYSGGGVDTGQFIEWSAAGQRIVALEESGVKIALDPNDNMVKEN